MNAVTADGSLTDVATSETTTSTTYADLTTVGPTATLSVVNGQQVLVIIACRLKSSTTTVGATASFAASGAISLSALDANGVENDNTDASTCSRASFLTMTSTATLTAVMKYKVQNAGTGTFLERRIMLKKF